MGSFHCSFAFEVFPPSFSAYLVYAIRLFLAKKEELETHIID